MTTQAVPSQGPSEATRIVIWQIAVGIMLLAAWEAVGWYSGGNWTSRPSQIAHRLVVWLMDDLVVHTAYTVSEMLLGMGIGVPAGIACGLWLGRSPVLATVLRPIIVALYSIPLVTMAPLLIVWFGVDMQPKIVLVAAVVFFILFFNTFSGAQKVDKDVIATFQLGGANRREQFIKVVAPACTAWIMAGIKIALPYALVAATTGEILAARKGLGALISRAAGQFDMTGLYTALFVLMLIGVVVSETAMRIERWALRWRDTTQ